MKTERSNGPLVAGTLLVAFGLLALLSQLLRNVISWSYLWPLVVILFGALFFAGMFTGGRQTTGLAVPGAIITGIGLMLLYQRLANHWESWAYFWSLIILFVGAGIYIMGAYGGSEGQKASGVKLMKIGFVLFVIFGAFFEMIFSADRPLGFRGLLFPSLLILLGVYIVLERLGILGGRKSAQPESLPPEPPPANQ